jgi:ABC-2 type transport system ATP-binding protein
MTTIEVKDLTKSFKEVEAVKGISFKVRKGEIFGFLGPNGAGKTTTISVLCTLLKPTSGVARLAGYDVVKNPAQVRAAIGIVFQDPSLDERLSAYENLLFHALVYAVPRQERQERIERILKMVELWPRRQSLVKTFSGGMKRRLEIGRGLLHYPQVLFLDEPTLGLDPQTRNHIWEYIHMLKEREKITIFLTTHYMDEAENCDRIAIIDEGKIIALDTPANLKARIGGDVVTLEVSDVVRAKEEIARKFKLPVYQKDSTLMLEVKEPDSFLPRLLKQTDAPINSVSVRRPTLDDVFLKLTGREIREEVVGAMDGLRARVRSRRLR